MSTLVTGIFHIINQSSTSDYFIFLNLLSNSAFLTSIISLGNEKLKLCLQSFMTSMLDVLKSFIKNLVTAKSRDLTSDLGSEKHSRS